MPTSIASFPMLRIPVDDIQDAVVRGAFEEIEKTFGALVLAVAQAQEDNLKDDVVTNQKIADLAVDTENLAAEAVELEKMLEGAASTKSMVNPAQFTKTGMTAWTDMQSLTVETVGEPVFLASWVECSHDDGGDITFAYQAIRSGAGGYISGISSVIETGITRIFYFVGGEASSPGSPGSPSSTVYKAQGLRFSGGSGSTIFTFDKMMFFAQEVRK